MNNQEAIWKLEDIAMVLKDQCHKLDKVCMAGKAPPHYPVQLAKFIDEILDYSRTINIVDTTTRG